MNRSPHYPVHLAKLVAARLLSEYGHAPRIGVLTRFLETLYFAGLKTEEGQPPLCTVNYIDPETGRPKTASTAADCWQIIPFASPLPFDIRTLTKLARAVDPAVSSLAVFADSRGELFIWGMVDQELRYSDFIALDAAITPDRPGILQATINGVGNVSVYVNYALIGSLEQNTLVQEYHDVLWQGPIHRALTRHCEAWVAEERPALADEGYDPLECGLLVRWLNAVCRILLNIQRYKHGGGLLIVPEVSFEGLNAKYRLRYDRLPRALLGIDRNEYLRGRVASEIAGYCHKRELDVLPCTSHYDQKEFRKRYDEHKSEVLGCTHFLAALSRVDGFVLLDRNLVGHAFGVEVRSDNPLNEILVAGDPEANPSLLRRGELSQFGTRHRAMMRYCCGNPGAIGFVVSQDGDIRAMMSLDGHPVLWENIEVQLAFRAENGKLIGHQQSSKPDSSAPRVA